LKGAWLYRSFLIQSQAEYFQIKVDSIAIDVNLSSSTFFYAAGELTKVPVIAKPYTSKSKESFFFFFERVERIQSNETVCSTASLSF
jgi:hypothetical protein